MKTCKTSLLLSLLVLAPIASCATYLDHRHSHRYSSSTARHVSDYGVVTRIQVMNDSSRKIGSGTILGAVLGAFIGNQVGGGNGRAAATGIGALGGALVGHKIEKRGRRRNEFYRVSVRFDGARSRQFDYRDIGELRVGDQVQVERGGLRLY